MLRILILSCFVLVGALVMFASYGPARAAREASGWSSMPAIITSATAEGITIKHKNHSTGKMEDRITFRPSVTFDYSIDGVLHTGTNLSFSQRTYPSIEGALALVDGFPIGSTTEIYYNPQAPSESVIKLEGEPSYLFTYFGILLMGFGTFYIVKPLVMKKRA